MKIYDVLEDYFGYDEFRIGQKELIDGVLNNRDALGIMPTGGGKSLCYQLPAMLMPGITLVISPLIALMKDQVDNLSQIGLPATFINSTLGDQEFRIRMDEIESKKYKLVYVAPERLDTFSFRELIHYVDISMIAVDEAHCISQWGHDFRPAYRDIPRFINSLEDRPVVSAYTATATEQVTEDILNLLDLRDPVKSIVGFDRPNLFYSVVKTGDKFGYVKDFIDENYKGKSGIIYCSTRKSVESLASNLSKSGYSVVDYHGGMTPNQREDRQNKFILDQVDIIVATNAFGMGIDKPDIRYVIHYNMPQNMESYYQEAGRAGRDGVSSDCVLMYSPGDIVKQKLLIQNQTYDDSREQMLYENLQYLIDYCHSNDCLRKLILEYFDEKVSFEKCDNCGNCLDDSEMVDITVESQKILSCIYRVDERYGINMLINVLRGSRNKRVLDNGLDKVSTYGIMKDYSNEGIREIIMTLIARDYIHLTADRYPVLKLKKEAGEILNGDIKLHHKKDLVHYKKRATREKREVNLENFEPKLYEKLRDLRTEISKDKGLPPFMIFHDSSLEEMASTFPRERKDFLNIKGVGNKKYETYGEEFIKLIDRFVGENKLVEPELVEVQEESLNERYLKTYELYEKGLSLKEVSEERGYVESTIINHLKKCEDEGYAVDWYRYISEERERRVLEVITQVGTEKLSEIKKRLPDDYSYEDIHMVINMNGLRV